MNISGFPPVVSSYAAASRARPEAAGGVAKADAASRQAANGLSKGEAAQLRELQARDREVRQHEQAHLAAAGGLATSGASYSYQKGPDGVNYAVGGEVNIDTSPGATPEETIQKARTIRAAALAPADPSGQDRAVAAQAGQMMQQASVEQTRQQTAAAGDPGGGDGGSNGAGAGNNEAGIGDTAPGAARVERYYAAAGVAADTGSFSAYA